MGRRCRRHRLRGRTVNVKIRFADFHTITRAQTLPQATFATDDIWEVAAELLANGLKARRQGVRLLGVGMSNLEDGERVQLQLFADEEDQKKQKLDAMADEINAKFGTAGLSRASGLLHNAHHRPQPRPSQ